MKWKAKVEPKEGDKKTVVRFALLPVLSRENEWIWLETYVATYEYVHSEWFFVKVNGLYAR